MAEGNVKRITVCYSTVVLFFFLLLLGFQEFSKLLLANILVNAGEEFFDERSDSCVSQALSQNEMCLHDM